jgi:hypothetical protein
MVMLHSQLQRSASPHEPVHGKLLMAPISRESRFFSMIRRTVSVR